MLFTEAETSNRQWRARRKDYVLIERSQNAWLPAKIVHFIISPQVRQ